MQTDQTRVYAITLTNNTTWLIFADNESSALNAVKTKIIATVVVNNPGKTVLINNAQSFIDNARVEQISFTVNEFGNAVLNFDDHEYALVINIPIQHASDI